MGWKQLAWHSIQFSGFPVLIVQRCLGVKRVGVWSGRHQALASSFRVFIRETAENGVLFCSESA